jgi:hypothetical protein
VFFAKQRIDKETIALSLWACYDIKTDVSVGKTFIIRGVP